MIWSRFTILERICLSPPTPYACGTPPWSILVPLFLELSCGSVNGGEFQPAASPFDGVIRFR